MEGSVTPSAPTPSAPKAGWSPANPAPLGLAGFAMTTFVLSMINGNLVSGTDLPVVLGLALAYGGVAQLLAGMWEFRAGNTFGAVAFSSFGAFWISYFVLVMFNAGSLVPAHAGHAIGLYLWAWAIFTFYMTLAALRTNGAVLLVFVLLTITFVLLAIGADGGHMARHPLGRLHRPGHRGRRVVCLVCAGHQQHLREDGRAALPAQQVAAHRACSGCRGTHAATPGVASSQEKQVAGRRSRNADEAGDRSASRDGLQQEVEQ